MLLRSKLRFFSWVVAAASVLAPSALLAYQLAQLSKWAKAQGGLVCGMPVLAMWFLAIISCTILSLIASSLIASSLNGVHLWRSSPVTAKRYAELGIIAAPAIVGVALVIFAAIKL